MIQNSSLEYRYFFEGKKITKQGFGILGRGFGATRFLLESGAIVLVTDSKEPEIFKEQIQELKKFCITNNIPESNISYRFGEHSISDFTDCDMVVQASGVPKENIYLEAARAKNIPVYQEGSLFCEIVRNYNEEHRANIKICGVTGTRGKTTTTFLLYTVVSSIYGAENVHIGGNIQGVSTLELLKVIKPGDYVVMELDSWVLQGFGDIGFSPNISIFTNFMPDHMNYYNNDMLDYFRDKSKIFINQKPGDILVSDKEILEDINRYLGADYRVLYGLNNKEIFIDDAYKIKNQETKLMGKHNQKYLQLVTTAVLELGISNERSLKIIKEFSGVPGRLETVKVIRGIQYINDTTATTGEAAIVAIDSASDILKTGSKLVLITGGRDKDLDITSYASKIIDSREFIRKIFFLNDQTTTGTHKLIELLKKSPFNVASISVSSVDVAVNEAASISQEGDIILFTPGFASFGMFSNEYDRGDRFNMAVSKIS